MTDHKPQLNSSLPKAGNHAVGQEPVFANDRATQDGCPPGCLEVRRYYISLLHDKNSAVPVTMNRNIIAGIVLLFALAAGAWMFLAPSRDSAASLSEAGAMSPLEFSRESPLLLPGLLADVYEAFGETGEAAIYDRLAEVVTGPALEQLYLERVGAMAGGGLNPDQEIHEVSLLGMSARPKDNTVTIEARWRVLGVVGHSEHMHMRGNAYAADLVMAPEAGTWKIIGFTLTDVDRTDAGTLERNADAPPPDEGDKS